MLLKSKPLKKWLLRLADVKIGIACLFCLFILTIAGTLAQVQQGIYAVTKQYFSSYWVYYPIGSFEIPVFPGALTLGFILLINLLAAHLTRLKLKLKNIGIWLIHAGVVVLIIGAGLTSFFAQESQMIINEGEKRYYSENFESSQLYIRKPLNNGEDEVIVFNPSHFNPSQHLSHPNLDVDIKVLAFYKNSLVSPLDKKRESFNGIGAYELAQPSPVVSNPNFKNVPSLILEITPKNSQENYLFLASTAHKSRQKIPLSPYDIQLVYERHYSPYAIQLIDFKHDKYQRTDIPKNFSSEVAIFEDDVEIHKQVISMNKPLRFAGNTYFQASFGKDERTSVLQVVRNPSWLLPYISTIMMSLGLVLQFGIGFFVFYKKRRLKAVENT